MAVYVTLFDITANLSLACKAAGSPAAWAAKNKISKQYVSAVLTGETRPGPKILKALGYCRKEVYERV